MKRLISAVIIGMALCVFASSASADERDSPGCGHGQYPGVDQMWNPTANGYKWVAQYNAACGGGTTTEWEIQSSSNGSSWSDINDLNDIALDRVDSAPISGDNFYSHNPTSQFSCNSSLFYRLVVYDYNGFHRSANNWHAC